MQKMATIVEVKHLIAVLFILWTCACPAMSRTLNEASVAKTHQQWMEQFGRSYADDAEKEKRFNIFTANLKYIENFNKAGNKSYKMGLNQFADYTTEEFIASHTGLKISSLPHSSKMASVGPVNMSELPINTDWRTEGAVTPIKNQQQCGSCWAFSAVAAVEGIVKIKTGKLVSLSEQQLVDCASNQQNQGCGGGYMDNAFQYIIGNKGIASESDYSYQGIDEACNDEMASHAAAQISGYEDVTPNSEEQLLAAVANQPVSVAISADSRDFLNYKEGIFTGTCGTTLNHGVTAIGYGTSEDGTKYWLIKNSWGESWGDGGYMKLQREIGTPEGLCGVAMKASYPTLA